MGNKRKGIGEGRFDGQLLFDKGFEAFVTQVADADPKLEQGVGTATLSGDLKAALDID